MSSGDEDSKNKHFECLLQEIHPTLRCQVLSGHIGVCFIHRELMGCAIEAVDAPNVLRVPPCLRHQPQSPHTWNTLDPTTPRIS